MIHNHGWFMKMLKITLLVILVIGSFIDLHAQVPEAYSKRLYQYPLPPTSMQYRNFGRIWVEKSMDQDGYKLHIHTSDNTDPQSIEVKIVGRTIVIQNKQSHQKEEITDRGFYSYSRSSSNFRRRFSVPRNADTENIQRKEENGIITITLPFLYGIQER
jgi:hypothetical protein